MEDSITASSIVDKQSFENPTIDQKKTLGVSLSSTVE